MRKATRKLSFLEAAFTLLVKAGKPMHYRDLTDLALKRKLILTSGKTPEQTLGGLLRLEIRNKGTKSRFFSKGNGIYALSRYGKRLAKKLKK